jgi:hypothetical protein
MLLNDVVARYIHLDASCPDVLCSHAGLQRRTSKAGWPPVGSQHRVVRPPTASTGRHSQAVGLGALAPTSHIPARPEHAG